MPEPRPVPKPLKVILLSGCFDRVHYGLCIASAAAALDRPVTVFVTLAATRAFVARDVTGGPGWASLPVSDELADAEARDGGALDARHRTRGIAGFEDLVQACASLGVELMVCEMGLRALGLQQRDLRRDLPLRSGGLASLLARAGETLVL